MKVNSKQDPTCEDVEVTLKYPKEDDLVQRLLSFLATVDKQLDCYDETGRQMKVNLSDIYYIESVDKKTFVYLEKAVYQTNNRLYQLLEDLKNDDFIRISKACLLNLNVLESVRPIFNSRMEATLRNNEKVYISRHYLASLKKALRGGSK
ncbi:LytTR family DNA-binding domain-containing protein [Streptococcus macacae]|uniref:LytTr DNA-binding domain protein n=1 Tax=Streptococcus macacae NCTC 11558 TaxID=764298 RepID=G5JW42_9STRE|nr:LytTR family DNA-binding domain-containing protein [Streptococcus macacae]EHJ53243.1 LytTr DNA-binding domain protein [Streptococcus macacae NCTC 11558]SUN79378.1 two-component response regulator [Streptococcus macacae NCTC 11558]